MKDISIMEVCGTHTMAIAKAGIKKLLPENIRLVSGPGCPVCVTPQEEIDAFLKLSENRNVIIATYGDMLRVPGSIRGDNLYRRKALGADVRIVYSPVDAVETAKENPGKEIVFLGVGFETTTPGTAAAIKKAALENARNFSVISMLKTVEPAIRKLAGGPDFNIHAFLCPGHVAVITGEEGFAFIPEELKLPAVIAGFEPAEIIKAITLLLRQIEAGVPRLENAYKSVVTRGGNLLAKHTASDCFEPCGSLWRGLGFIENSGLKIKDEYKEFDAEAKFGTSIFKEAAGNMNSASYCLDVSGLPMNRTASAGNKAKGLCLCGEIICGKARPQDCPLFGTGCTPEEPEGPCMVSGEGACAAAYKYR